MTWFLFSAVLKNLPLHTPNALSLSFSLAYYRPFLSRPGGVQTLTSLVPFFFLDVLLNRIMILG